MQTERKTSSAIALLPILFGFFVMGFVDIIGTATSFVKTECGLSDKIAGFLPSMIFIWFFLISVPASLLCGKLGRKNTVLLSLFITIFAMFFPLAAGPKAVWIYFLSFALLGIGNTIIQAALPSLMSNVVPQDQLTSRISLGQFVKALCAAVSPLIAAFAAKSAGNWKLIFPIYGGLTILSAVWLLMTSIPKEESSASSVSFGSCIKMLGNPYIFFMFTGIFFSVGADVGFNVGIPPLLEKLCKMKPEDAAMAPSVYFVAKTIGSILGAAIFAKIAASKCFPFSVLLSIVATVAMFFLRAPVPIFICIFIASLGLANTFGMAFGLAMNRVPEKANEISGLMVMAIAGGAFIPPLMGWAQTACHGVQGIIYVLLACLLYLLGLGIFAFAQKK